MLEASNIISGVGAIIYNNNKNIIMNISAVWPTCVVVIEAAAGNGLHAHLLAAKPLLGESSFLANALKINRRNEITQSEKKCSMTYIKILTQMQCREM